MPTRISGTHKLVKYELECKCASFDESIHAGFMNSRLMFLS